MAEDQGRQSPASEKAERAVLGCILSQNDLINQVAQVLQVEDFYFPKHRLIYQAMTRLSAQQEPIDAFTLAEALQSEGAAPEFQEADYYLSFQYGPFYTTNLDSYLEIVKKYAVIRKLIDFGDGVKARSLDPEAEVGAILESAEKDLVAITQNQLNSGLTGIRENLEEALERINELSVSGRAITGIPTGFRDLDKNLSGLQNSDLVLLAGRPSMGKTSLAMNMAYNAARYKDEEGNHPYKVAIFSLEMSKLQLTQRLLSVASGLDARKIMDGSLEGSEDWDLLMTGFKALEDLPIYMDDTSSISIEALRSKCRRMKMEQGLDLIVIDYMQLMTVDQARASDNRQQEITTISRGLKGLAKELNCPVLALSQLSRKAEAREGQRPVMSDLRESGAIEQDADVVMLLYREDYYNEETENKNQTEVIIAKHRNGPTGTVKLYFNKELTRFNDLAYDSGDF